MALNDEEPVRGHAAWALGRIASALGSSAEAVSSVGVELVRRLALEEDAWVREEISLALGS